MKNDYDFYNNVAETNTNERKANERKANERKANDRNKPFKPESKPQTTAKMNCTINTSTKTAYHIFTNVVFTAVVDIMKYHEYHLFIKYGDKVYMDVRGVGEVVISFDELQKNEQWKQCKQYYDLSLLLTKDKHSVVYDSIYSSKNTNHPNAYSDVRFWSIHTSFIDAETKAITEGYACHYKINPYDLVDMEYTSQKNVALFQQDYAKAYVFFKELDTYNSLAKQLV
jgi:hypothetical protein